MLTLTSRYIVRQTIPWVLVALLGSMLVFVTTQLIRIAPLIIGHGAGVGQTALALALLLVPVAGWALTPALVIALFATGGRMARDGELTVLDAAGVRRHRIVAGPVALALVVTGVSAWVWLDAAPRSQRVLRSLAAGLVQESIVGRIVPGRFYRDIPGVTFLADVRNEDGTFGGVFIETVDEQGKSVQAVAKSARISADVTHLELAVRLEQGTAFTGVAGPLPGGGTGDERDGSKTALSFGHLNLRLALASEIEGRLNFLPRTAAETTQRLMGRAPPGTPEPRWRFALWRRLMGPVGTLLISLLSIFLAFTTRWKSRGSAVGLALIIFLCFHVLGRFSETLMASGRLPVPGAALLPSAAVCLGLVALLFHPRTARRR